MLQPNKHSPDVSVIIINWNALETTSRLITSIQRETRPIDYELVVVDNGSLDASRVALPQRFPSIKLIANPRNMGFARAANQGITAASARYVLLLNNDMLVLSNVLEQSVQYMDMHQDVGALGVLHLDGDGHLQRSWSVLPNPVRELLGTIGLCRVAQDGEREWCVERNVDWLCGSFLLIRRACLEQVGTLDERFFAYEEDIDWCKRAVETGWCIRFWPGASIVHFGSGTRPFMRDKTFVHFRSRLSYLYKHHSFPTTVAYYLILTAMLTAATARQTVRYLCGKATTRQLIERCMRQVRFQLLRPGQSGG